jgi:hypothetical protein
VRRRRLLIVLVVLVTLAVIAIPALSGASPAGHAAAAKIIVKPAVGTPHTRFAVDFQTPGALRVTGGLSNRYLLTASDRRQRGCASNLSASVVSVRQGMRLKLTLAPAGADGAWCPGTFKGRIVAYQTPLCGPLRMCPQFIRVVGTVGRLSFRVKRAG